MTDKIKSLGQEMEGGWFEEGGKMTIHLHIRFSNNSNYILTTTDIKLWRPNTIVILRTML